jgi:saccharopine dehydrogenase-like NADP-dependent oxidoreductase
MSNIIVLGAGMVGSAMAADLAKNHSVTVADLNAERLLSAQRRSNTLSVMELNVRDPAALRSAVSPFELVVCAVPGYLGFETVKCIIESGKNIVDISFFPENALELDVMAKAHGVTAIVDCGVAPGMDNIILGRYNEQMELTDFECMVGGLPKVKKWPFYYKAPFSPVDVIEEYTRPARYVENGNVIVREALSDCELVDFDHAGTLEAFNTDGLRSIILTMPHIRNMKEKTLRYPGHVEVVRALKESGFFSLHKISVNGQEIIPRDVTSKILFAEWKLGDTEPEITVMRIRLRGKNTRGEREEIEFNLYDEYDAESRTSSMARTTGYTATAVANMFLSGLFSDKGVFPPELIGKHERCYTYIMDYLSERNVKYTRKSSILAS